MPPHRVALAEVTANHPRFSMLHSRPIIPRPAAFRPPNDAHNKENNTPVSTSKSTVRFVDTPPVRTPLITLHNGQKRPTPAYLSPSQGVGDYSEGDSQEELTVFDTNNLQPIRQLFRRGAIEILDNGSVLLLVKSQSSQMYSVSLISNDGQELDVYNDVSSLETRNLLDSEPITYTVDQLTPDLCKRYRFAYRFIELVKSRTPRLVFRTGSQSTCTIMSNALPDVELSRNQTKVRITMHDGDPVFLFNLTPSTTATIPIIQRDHSLKADMLSPAWTSASHETIELIVELERLAAPGSTINQLVEGLKADHSIPARSSGPSNRNDPHYVSGVGWYTQNTLLFLDGFRITVSEDEGVVRTWQQNEKGRRVALAPDGVYKGDLGPRMKIFQEVQDQIRM